MYSAFVYVDGDQFDAAQFLAIHGRAVGGMLRLSRTAIRKGTAKSERSYWVSDKLVLDNVDDRIFVDFISHISIALQKFSLQTSTEVCLVLVNTATNSDDSTGLFIPPEIMTALAEVNGSIDINDGLGATD